MYYKSLSLLFVCVSHRKKKKEIGESIQQKEKERERTRSNACIFIVTTNGRHFEGGWSSSLLWLQKGDLSINLQLPLFYFIFLNIILSFLPLWPQKEVQHQGKKKALCFLHFYLNFILFFSSLNLKMKNAARSLFYFILIPVCLYRA